MYICIYKLVKQCTVITLSKDATSGRSYIHGRDKFVFRTVVRTAFGKPWFTDSGVSLGISWTLRCLLDMIWRHVLDMLRIITYLPYFKKWDCCYYNTAIYITSTAFTEAVVTSYAPAKDMNFFRSKQGSEVINVLLVLYIVLPRLSVRHCEKMLNMCPPTPKKWLGLALH